MFDKKIFLRDKKKTLVGDVIALERERERAAGDME